MSSTSKKLSGGRAISAVPTRSSLSQVRTSPNVFIGPDWSSFMATRRHRTTLFIDIYVDYHNAMQEYQSGPMKTFGDVRTWLSDDLVGTAEIARPPDNFFDVELIASLADAYAWLDGQAGARAVVLCSEGKHFCAGADFSGRSGQARPGAGGARNLYVEAVRLFEAQLPVVAAVQGAAVGGGLGLACSADFRVASPQARFVANFARLGLHHGFGLTVTLPPIVGQQRALDMPFTGSRRARRGAAPIARAAPRPPPPRPRG